MGGNVAWKSNAWFWIHLTYGKHIKDTSIFSNRLLTYERRTSGRGNRDCNIPWRIICKVAVWNILTRQAQAANSNKHVPFQMHYHHFSTQSIHTFQSHYFDNSNSCPGAFCWILSVGFARGGDVKSSPAYGVMDFFKCLPQDVFGCEYINW